MFPDHLTADAFERGGIGVDVGVQWGTDIMWTNSKKKIHTKTSYLTTKCTQPLSIPNKCKFFQHQDGDPIPLPTPCRLQTPLTEEESSIRWQGPRGRLERGRPRVKRPLPLPNPTAVPLPTSFSSKRRKSSSPVTSSNCEGSELFTFLFQLPLSF